MRSTLILLVTPLLTATLAAQTASVVVPNVNTAREGSSASRTPFSHPRARIQWLADGAQICKTSAVLTSLELRLDGFNFDRAGLQGTVEATGTLYQTTLKPSTLTNTWLQNLGSATGKQLISGKINLPAASQKRPLPNDWSIRIPLSQPFVYLRAQGNLLLDLETKNGTSTDWPLDGIFVNGSGTGSQVIKIWQNSGCRNARGDSASLSISSSQGALGQGLQVTHSVNPAPSGQLDVVVHWLGLSNSSYGALKLPFSLGGLGYQNCELATDLVVLAATTGTGVTWPIPSIPSLEGTALYFQALAIDSKTLDSVITSNAYQVLLGGASTIPEGPLQMLHRGPYSGETTGFLSPSGYYGAIFKLNGSFN